MNKKNILLIWARMGDYHRARWQALKNTNKEGQVSAADNGQSDHLYGWENTAEHELYTCFSQRPADQPDLWNRFRNFIGFLKTKNIQIVCIPGYGRPEYLLYILYCRLSDRRVILFAESWYGNNKWFNWLKGRFLNFCCSGFFVSGLRAREHFIKRLGIPGKKIKMGYSVVDNSHFAKAIELRPEPPPKILLCVARFSMEKNLSRLIEAFQASSLPAKGWRLRLVGGGPDEQALRQLADKQVEFLNWVSYQKLPEIYAEAAVFILPSTFEPWGLVVNEAMAAGLPILLSKQSGAQPDLGREKNAIIFDAENTDSIREALLQFISLPQSCKIQMGQQSINVIKEYSLQEWGDTLLRLADA